MSHFELSIHTAPRAAIYAFQTRAPKPPEVRALRLLDCARHAQRSGFRIVTVAQEEGDYVPIAEVRSKLNGLLDRMRSGEFEAIFANTAPYCILKIEAAVQNVSRASGAVH